jgi:hypothetical protein
VDLGRYDTVTLEEMGSMFDAIGNAEQSKKVMVDSGVDDYKVLPEDMCNQAFENQFVWHVYLKNIQRELKTSPLNLVEVASFRRAVHCLITDCDKNKMRKEQLMNVYENCHFIYLLSQDQATKMCNDIEHLETEIKRGDCEIYEPIVERCLMEIAIIICDLKNTALEARDGTLLANIPEDLFHALLKRFDYPERRAIS